MKEKITLIDTQKIPEEKIVEDIRPVEDGHDLLFWHKMLSPVFVLNLVNKIKLDPEIIYFCKQVVDDINVKNIRKILTVLQSSQNTELKKKVGLIMSEELDQQSKLDLSVDLRFDHLTEEQKDQMINLIKQDQYLLNYLNSLEETLEAKFGISGNIRFEDLISKLLEFLSQGSVVEKDLANKLERIVDSVIK